MNTIIKCPQCSTEISVDEVLAHQIGDKLRQQYEADQKIKEEEINQKQKSLIEQEQKIATTQANIQQAINERVAKALETEKTKLKTEVQVQLEKEKADEIKLLNDQLTDISKKLAEARQNELDLRKAKLQLDDEKKNFELEKQRQLDEERQKIAEDAAQKASEALQYKLGELNKQLTDAQKANEELNRKLLQGSQQTQGEVQELELEELLKREFARDEIMPIGKGESGADITQKVFDNFGHYCGTIIWESKHTKSWADSWITKLKTDQRNAKAELAVIVSSTMPKDIKSLGQKEGVWVCEINSAVGLATVLRSTLIQLNALKLANVGKNEKMELIFNYLTGPNFSHRIESIVESFIEMRNSLEKEKLAMKKIWSSRETQLNQVLENTVGMYGDLEGLTGQALPKIDLIELPSGE